MGGLTCQLEGQWETEEGELIQWGHSEGWDGTDDLIDLQGQGHIPVNGLFHFTKKLI